MYLLPIFRILKGVASQINWTYSVVAFVTLLSSYSFIYFFLPVLYLSYSVNVPSHLHPRDSRKGFHDLLKPHLLDLVIHLEVNPWTRLGQSECFPGNLDIWIRTEPDRSHSGMWAWKLPAAMFPAARRKLVLEQGFSAATDIWGQIILCRVWRAVLCTVGYLSGSLVTTP